ncbi:MAG: helix-turn-helix transcriptional regulator [Planctomycetota bacterium]
MERCPTQAVLPLVGLAEKVIRGRYINEPILNQVAVRTAYRSASKGREVISDFHPYGVVLLHASLYCIGYLVCYEDVRTLKVSRIQGLHRLDKTFQKPADFSLATHLEGAFGVFHAQNPRTIQAEFTGWAATSLREMQWHPSQQVVEDDGETVVATFELGNTVEFKRWILGFGRYARVLEPKVLAEHICEEHLAAAEYTGKE